MMNEGTTTKEATISKTDAANAIAEIMNAWNTIEARVRAAYPNADKDTVYCITAAAMTKAVGA